MANAILLYTHPDCSFSDALKDELDTAGTDYDEINLALRPEAWLDLEKLTGGASASPPSWWRTARSASASTA